MVLVWREKANGDAEGETGFSASVVNFCSDVIADLSSETIEGRNLEQAKSNLGSRCDCGMRCIVADGLGYF